MLLPTASFELQGHRGARGLEPENTLPSFETAMDCGVSSIETDVHLSADNVPILFHDPQISDRLCRVRPGFRVPDPASWPRLRSLTAKELYGYVADRNPDRDSFPNQAATSTPLAQALALSLGKDPFGLPTLHDLFALALLYAGDAGAKAGKTAAQQQKVRALRFDLEIKRVAWTPEDVGGALESGGDLLETLVERAIVANASWLRNVTVRSFDHRSVRLIRQHQPFLAGAVLIEETTPIDPAKIAHQADAQIYCPEYRCLDRWVVEQCHAAGIRVIPWTVNDEDDVARLLDWGVDGVTTDYPDRMADLLRKRGIAF